MKLRGVLWLVMVGKRGITKKAIIIGSIAAVVVLAGIAIYFFIQNQHKDEKKCFSSRRNFYIKYR